MRRTASVPSAGGDPRNGAGGSGRAALGRPRVGQRPGAVCVEAGFTVACAPVGPCPFAAPWLVGDDETGLTLGYWKV